MILIDVLPFKIRIRVTEKTRVGTKKHNTPPPKKNPKNKNIKVFFYLGTFISLNWMRSTVKRSEIMKCNQI